MQLTSVRLFNFLEPIKVRVCVRVFVCVWEGGNRRGSLHTHFPSQTSRCVRVCVCMFVCEQRQTDGDGGTDRQSDRQEDKDRTRRRKTPTLET